MLPAIWSWKAISSSSVEAARRRKPCASGRKFRQKERLNRLVEPLFHLSAVDFRCRWLWATLVMSCGVRASKISACLFVISAWLRPAEKLLLNFCICFPDRRRSIDRCPPSFATRSSGCARSTAQRASTPSYEGPRGHPRRCRGGSQSKLAERNRACPRSSTPSTPASDRTPPLCLST